RFYRLRLVEWPGQPRAKTPQRERDSGPNKKRASERRQSGDGLAHNAGHFSGVCKPQERTQFPPSGVTRKGLPSRGLARLSIQRELRALVRLAAVALVDRECQWRVRRVWHPQTEAPPTGDLLRRARPQSVEII